MSSTILTPSHLIQLNAALDQIARIQAEIDLAKRAGVPIGTLGQQLQDNVDRLRQIKQTYFPGQ